MVQVWWVKAEWSEGQWIVVVMSFQKIYGLYGLTQHKVQFFLAALAALYLTLVSQWVTATLEFKHKE